MASGTQNLTSDKARVLSTNPGNSVFWRGDNSWSNILGGPLYINDSTDVGLDQNGALIIGLKSGLNIGIDDNEIMARNNSAASTLYLNNEGGLIQTGSGGITSGGTIHSDGGYLKSTKDGNTVTIGSQNTSWCHIQNSANIAFYFNRAVHVDGDVYRYNTTVHMSSSGFHPPKNGGIYWDPYVESSSDASDASSIYQIASGIAGGTELRISQANDSTDVINLVSPYYIYLNSKRAFTIYDSWLRINEDLGFGSGIYTGSSLIRTDNQLQVGSSGTYFYATTGSTRVSTMFEVINDSSNNGNDALAYFRHRSNNDWTVKIDSSGYDYGLHVVTADNAGNAIVTNGNVSGHMFWANQGTTAERQIGVDNSTAGNLYLWSNTSEKGIYSSSGYQTGYVIRITSGERRFYGTATNADNFYTTGASSTLYLVGVPAYSSTHQTGYIYSPNYINSGNYYGYGMLMPTNVQSYSTSQPMGICYGRVQCYGTLNINADTDGSQTEYCIITSGRGCSSSTSDGLWVGYNSAGFSPGTFSVPNGLICNHGVNFMVGGNEVNFIPDGYNNTFWFNYTTFNRQSNGYISTYIFGNGQCSGTAGISCGPISCGSLSCSYVSVSSQNGSNEGGEVYLASAPSYGYDAAMDVWQTRWRVHSNGYVRFWVDLTSGSHSDYAEERLALTHEPGRVYNETNECILIKTNRRLIPGCSVCSDTYGTVIAGKDGDIPFAVSGRVLVYTYRARHEYQAGMAVCSAPNGTVDIMTREEIKEYPDCIVGYVAGIPSESTWNEPNIKLNSRIWIRLA